MVHYITYKELAGYIAAFKEEYGINTLDELYEHLKSNESDKIEIVR